MILWWHRSCPVPADRPEIESLGPVARIAHSERGHLIRKIVFQPDPAEAALEQAIIRVLAYSDVFDYPLTAEEIHRYLEIPASLNAVQDILHNGSLALRSIRHNGDYFTLPGRETIVSTRLRRTELAAQIWPKARRYGQWMAHLPFVSMVAITGSLAVDNIEAKADIDYLIVTEPGRLWLCRALVIILVRLVALWRGDIICPNYFISKKALVFEKQTLYTARELMQMVPLAGLEIYQQILQLNAWTVDFLPNAVGSPQRALPGNQRHHPIRRLVEATLRTSFGEKLERWEMNRKIHKFSHQGENQAEIAFCSDWCKGHFDGHEQRVLSAFTGRLRH